MSNYSSLATQLEQHNVIDDETDKNDPDYKVGIVGNVGKSLTFIGESRANDQVGGRSA